jgi:hypothetical protein
MDCPGEYEVMKRDSLGYLVIFTMAGASETADLYILNGDTVLLLAILIMIVFSA